MRLPLSQIARLVDGRLTGRGDIEITGADTIACARENQITLADSARLATRLSRSQAAAVIVDSRFEPDNIPYITVDDVHDAFAAVVRHFRPPRVRKVPQISPAAYISPSARLGSGVTVYPNATICDDVEIGADCVIYPGVQIMDGCRIGEQTTIFPNVALYEDTIIGRRVIIHSGAVLGAYGFGYSLVEGKHKLSHQLGYVEVQDDVEIGACTTIDRGTYGPTVVGAGTKLDNQVMVAHNARVGQHNLLCSQSGIAGSSTTGDYVVAAGQVGIRDHVTIGDRTLIGAKAGVMNDVPADRRVFGVPAIDEREQIQVWAAMHKLPSMRRKLIELQRLVQDLAEQIPGRDQRMSPPADAA
jgi:UDP-3-O-[3-hydroxymyristoyl] glucosamine N-acyltransferase